MSEVKYEPTPEELEDAKKKLALDVALALEHQIEQLAISLAVPPPTVIGEMEMAFGVDRRRAVVDALRRVAYKLEHLSKKGS